MQSKTKLAIFDLDGTLFDTKDVNYFSYKEALSDYGVEIDYLYFCRECNGKKYTDFLPKLFPFSEKDLLDIHAKKKQLYKKYLDKAGVNNSLFDIIEGIKSNYYIALVTTASKANTDQILSFFGKEKCFDLIITQDEIVKPKPDPEGFEKAVRYFNVDRDNVIIFEDSDVGIEAAKKITSKVYKIYEFEQ